MRPSRLSGDSGNASLEFITAGMILLVPLVYLVLTLSALQAGAFAVEGAARQAARVYVQAETESEAIASSARAIEFSLGDYGLDVANATVVVDCRPVPGSCLTRSGTVAVTVRLLVALPLVPSALNLSKTASVPLQATATQQVSRFWRTE